MKGGFRKNLIQSNYQIIVKYINCFNKLIITGLDQLS